MIIVEYVVAEYVDRRICTSLNVTVGEYVIAEYVNSAIAECVIAENVGR